MLPGMMKDVVAGMGAASLTDKFVPGSAIAKYGGGFVTAGLPGVAGVFLRDMLLGGQTAQGATGNLYG
jgi:hypothetical protein